MIITLDVKSKREGQIVKAVRQFLESYGDSYPIKNDKIQHFTKSWTGGYHLSRNMNGWWPTEVIVTDDRFQALLNDLDKTEFSSLKARVLIFQYTLYLFQRNNCG